MAIPATASGTVAARRQAETDASGTAARRDPNPAGTRRSARTARRSRRETRAGPAACTGRRSRKASAAAPTMAPSLLQPVGRTCARATTQAVATAPRVRCRRCTSPRPPGRRRAPASAYARTVPSRDARTASHTASVVSAVIGTSVRMKCDSRTWSGRTASCAAASSATRTRRQLGGRAGRSATPWRRRSPRRRIAPSCRSR